MSYANHYRRDAWHAQAIEYMARSGWVTIEQITAVAGFPSSAMPEKKLEYLARVGFVDIERRGLSLRYRYTGKVFDAPPAPEPHEMRVPAAPSVWALAGACA